ncbi:U-box domain-containing protein 38-like [Hibiscus syriacus]|uniref:U-box domain-containing protein 38-like n=1 Tax=Hibiscus syriacus TaxID=106335 RepID=A0A6A2Y049_HIBSY|nr:protein EARLY FLOWERING 5-like [Hibiscus syriacus]KAE8662667.1 U-box domain-containing protein 38-like [Hibiscus syriacus]
MKTTKGGKVMNPTDSYRKELRKKELKRNKKERKKVREVGILKKDPQAIKEQIDKLEMMKAEGALDKARKHKKRQLEDTLNLVLKKRKEYEDKMKEKGETPVMFSHLGPPRRRTTAEEDERAKCPKPEDSVYYHPTLNPTGAPPPGKPPMYKSSIGPRIPLSGASSSAAAASSQTESEDTSAAIPPPPPLPDTDKSNSGDVSVAPDSLPLPPPPPMPPKPATENLGIPLPPPPGPPPPPGSPPKVQVTVRPPLPPPPPLPQSMLPPLSGTSENEREKTSVPSDDSTSKELSQVPPPVMPSKLAINQAEDASSESDANHHSVIKDFTNMVPPPPPPPRQQPPVPGPAMAPVLHPDVLPPGISRFPPVAPPDMRAHLSASGLPGQAPPGMMVPLMPRPPLGPPPGPPPMMRPPLPPGPPPTAMDDYNYAHRPPLPQKPSYVKSAAPTVIKRPLAQHQPELTAMVPASVRVRREIAAPKAKPKPSLSTVATAAAKPLAPTIVKQESTSSSPAPKAQSIDDSYTAFLEDMKALGALDG